MRIGFDTRLIPYHRRGRGRYAYTLIRNLTEIDRDNEYIFFYSFLGVGEKAYSLNLSRGILKISGSSPI